MYKTKFNEHVDTSKISFIGAIQKEREKPEVVYRFDFVVDGLMITIRHNNQDILEDYRDKIIKNKLSLSKL